MISLEQLRASRKIGFLFCGGASRAVFQVGVVEALATLGIQPHICFGVSAGAWNAAAVAVGNGARLRSYWRFFTRMPYVDLGNLWRERSPFMWGRLHQRTFERYIGVASLRRADTLPVLIAVTRLKDRSQRIFDLRSCEDPLQILLATTYLPPFYTRPPLIEGEAYGDGGLSNSAPYEELFAQGCDAVVLISVKGESEGGIYRNPDEYDHQIPPEYSERMLVVRPRHRLPLGFIERSWRKLLPIIALGDLRVRELLLGERYAETDVAASGRSPSVHLAWVRHLARTAILRPRQSGATRASLVTVGVSGPPPSAAPHEHHVLHDIVEEHHDHQRGEHGDTHTHDAVLHCDRELPPGQ